MKSVVFAGFLLVFIIVLFGCQREENDNNHDNPPDDTTPDYRNPFIEDYYGFVVEMEWSVYDTNAISDTIIGLINVSKFSGYTVQGISNYIDIEHKVGITYAPYSTEYDDSGCGWIIYYTDGFLHPTISNNGILTYPELSDCENGYLNGYCNGDSISIVYGNYNKWGGFKNTIRGKRTAK